MNRMEEPEFRKQQLDHLREPHVAALNDLVDEINRSPPPDAGRAPYVAPLCGGNEAWLLSLLRDPGPEAEGSGFICVENPDKTASRLGACYAAAGIDNRAAVQWNAYPWYVHTQRRTWAKTHLDGPPVAALYEFVLRLTALRVVMLHGTQADWAWAKLLRLHSEFHRIKVVRTYHTSMGWLQYKPRGFIKIVDADLALRFQQAVCYGEGRVWREATEDPRFGPSTLSIPEYKFRGMDHRQRYPSIG